LVTKYPRIDKYEPDSVLVFYQDITAQKDNEKQLVDLNKTKDKFVSIIAHDLRSPFGSLVSFIEILMQDFDEFDRDKIKELIGQMHYASKQSFSLLDNLLEWARSQRGMMPFSPESTRLIELIKTSSDTIGPTALSKKIDITIDVPSECEIVVDRKMMSTVIRNLISNAVKFTPPNGKIHIEALQKETETIIKVEDAGVGMNEEQLNNLFKDLIVTSTKGTNGETGTGFGILMCKEFIQKHNGQLYAESEQEKGSVFTIILPNTEY